MHWFVSSCSSPSTQLCVLQWWLYFVLYFSSTIILFIFIVTRLEWPIKCHIGETKAQRITKLYNFSKSFLHCPKLMSYCVFHNFATEISTKYMRCLFCHEVVTKPAIQFSFNFNQGVNAPKRTSLQKN